MSLIGGVFVNITELQLETHRFREMMDFYANILRFRLVERDEGYFKVQAGASVLTFKGTSDDVQPFYHFAFNIPENSLSESIRWLADRGVEFLSTQDGEIEIDQGSKWNAHSCYFHDPAGNIVEFIARHDLDNASSGQFTVEDVLGISEIGLPVMEVQTVVEELRLECGLEEWKSENNPKFVALGSDDGMTIVVDHARPWFPSNALPVVSPIKAVIQTGSQGIWTWGNGQYEIRSV